MNARETYFWATAVQNAIADAMDGGLKDDAIAEMEQMGIVKAKVGPGFVVAAQSSRAVVEDQDEFALWQSRNGYVDSYMDFNAAVLTDREYDDLVAYVASVYPRAVASKVRFRFDPKNAVEGPDGTCVDPSTGEVIPGLRWQRATAYLKCVDAKNKKLSRRVLQFNAPPSIRALLSGEAFADAAEVVEEDADA